MRQKVRHGRFGGHYIPADRLAYWESRERTLMGRYGQWVTGVAVRLVFSGGAPDKPKGIPGRPYEVEVSEPPEEVERLVRWLKRRAGGDGPRPA